jgi:TPR repeat protein
MFFQHAAEAGLALGAIRLATTFDPTELTRLQAQGVRPDREEARRWYERARELGAPEAEERLARLGGS